MPEEQTLTPEEVRAIFKEMGSDYAAGKLRDTHGERFSELVEEPPQPRPEPEREQERER